MFTIEYYCDGCGVKINPEDRIKSLNHISEYLNSNEVPVFRGKILEVEGSVPIISEIFCPICLLGADTYWQNKLDMVNALVEEINKRLERHRKSYFETRRAALKKESFKKVEALN